MKRLLALVILIGLPFFGCQNSDNFSPVSPDSGPSHSNAIITDSVSSINVPVMEYTILVDGQKGGEYDFSPTYFDGNDTITSSISLTFPNGTKETPAFTGTKIFKVIIDLEHASMQFVDLDSPDGHITFNNNVKLSAQFNGVKPSLLGLLPSLMIDFVYIADDGSIEIIKNNGIVFKNNGNFSGISVNNAQLTHFSRYCWAT